MPYLSASVVVIHYEGALYQVYALCSSIIVIMGDDNYHLDTPTHAGFLSLLATNNIVQVFQSPTHTA